MPVQSKCAMCTKALESVGNKVRDGMFSCAGVLLTGVGFHARTKSVRSGRGMYGKNLGKGKSRTVIGIGGKRQQIVSRMVVEVSIGASVADDRETGRAVGWFSSVSDAVSAVVASGLGAPAEEGEDEEVRGAVRPRKGR